MFLEKSEVTAMNHGGRRKAGSEDCYGVLKGKVQQDRPKNSWGTTGQGL